MYHMIAATGYRIQERESFPVLLKPVKPRVKRLFYRGGWDKKLFDRCVAVVGSRRMTNYGERALEQMIPVLVDAEITVVSGFMYGIDQTAHRICLECGGKTIAVLGWGIGWTGISNDEFLISKKIVETGGLIMSEWQDETPQLWMFPVRNRIIAGLCQATLVIEAAAESGSLITAEWAKKFRRKVLAVPGPVTSKVSAGTNGLIKTGEAEMVTSGEEILSALGWQNSITYNVARITYREDNNQILKLLDNEGLTVDEIVKKLGRGVEEVGAELSLWQLRGKIVEKEGKYFLV